MLSTSCGCVGKIAALLQMCGNVLWYGVVRDYEAISYQFTPTFLRATNARKPLKPACTIPCVSNWPFLFFVIFLSNIRNLFNRSAAASWCVGVGWAGRLFCKPLVGALARGGQQMCLTAKGWAGRLERMLFVFVFCVGVL